MAERQGFEPWRRGYRLHTFQACAFDHSATSPHFHSGFMHEWVEEKRPPLSGVVFGKVKYRGAFDHSATSPQEIVACAKRATFGASAKPWRVYTQAGALFNQPFEVKNGMVCSRAKRG